jgi:hypothetical protein
MDDFWFHGYCSVPRTAAKGLFGGGVDSRLERLDKRRVVVCLGRIIVAHPKRHPLIECPPPAA